MRFRPVRVPRDPAGCHSLSSTHTLYIRSLQVWRASWGRLWLTAERDQSAVTEAVPTGMWYISTEQAHASYHITCRPRKTKDVLLSQRQRRVVPLKAQSQSALVGHLWGESARLRFRSGTSRDCPSDRLDRHKPRLPHLCGARQAVNLNPFTSGLPSWASCVPVYVRWRHRLAQRVHWDYWIQRIQQQSVLSKYHFLKVSLIHRLCGRFSEGLFPRWCCVYTKSFANVSREKIPWAKSTYRREWLR